eukprot:gnl/TRDRNA2_/TRDRNA2_163220_c1_seq1.p1 gnl/TRDRNA2_/TRDRNA2_163220_c1~~gnl/TRDRNA2_/TRDRNA2_163220_c1_seq1.p1  ORF type:complete len:209 (-),score=45.33 gnl/TRDRNA2_/TRDRNA2_163220_c1_seq1:69-695(-)
MTVLGQDGSCGADDKPVFLKPAYDMAPAPALALRMGPAPAGDACERLEKSSIPEMPEMPTERPSTPMTRPAERPPSASGERTSALSQGFMKVSEVEATKRLNDVLEKDNIGIEAEIARLLRMNLKLRDNIGIMEAMLGVSRESEVEEEESASGSAEVMMSGSAEVMIIKEAEDSPKGSGYAEEPTKVAMLPRAPAEARGPRAPRRHPS